MNPEQNNETTARLWSQFRRKVDKCNCPRKRCKGLKNRRILITIPQSHCRQHGHIEGGHNFHRLVNVDFQLEEHGGVNIQAWDNAPMEEVYALKTSYTYVCTLYIMGFACNLMTLDFLASSHGNESVFGFCSSNQPIFHW